MDYILLQPDDSVETVAARKLLLEIGECLFDLLPTNPRLRAVTFNSRVCCMNRVIILLLGRQLVVAGQSITFVGTYEGNCSFGCVTALQLKKYWITSGQSINYDDGVRN